jgi:hypothetical protein
MILHTFDPTNGVLHIQPKSSLEKADFEELAAAIDPIIAKTGVLAGIIIETPAFPGWVSFGALVAHLRFVREHHKLIKKIALVTDSALGNVAENLVSHFVSAEIKQFPASGLDAARRWVLEGK